ncbi:hypothetical protein NKG94_00960 [Micromonospora sp. M12]
MVASVPADRTGWHPYGNPDRSALAAMGIVELVLHTRDILGAHQIDYQAPAQIVAPCLDRIFAHALRCDDPWHDLLAATGRTRKARARLALGLHRQERALIHLTAALGWPAGSMCC